MLKAFSFDFSLLVCMSHTLFQSKILFRKYFNNKIKVFEIFLYFKILEPTTVKGSRYVVEQTLFRATLHAICHFLSLTLACFWHTGHANDLGLLYTIHSEDLKASSDYSRLRIIGIPNSSPRLMPKCLISTKKMLL